MTHGQGGEHSITVHRHLVLERVLSIEIVRVTYTPSLAGVQLKAALNVEKRALHILNR